MDRSRKIGDIAAFYTLVLMGILTPFFALSSHAASDELLGLQQAIQEQGARWEAGETSVSGLTFEEKRKLCGARRATPSELLTASPLPDFGALALLPPFLDWRANGGNFVTPIRDQRQCGSCWAFATLAALESKVLIRTAQHGGDVDLSEQVVISCGEAGDCSGGSSGAAAGFLMEWGAPLESCYPYAGGYGICLRSCPNWFNNTYKAETGYYAGQHSVEEFKVALLAFGPVVTTMEVFEDFYSYESGVYSHVSGNRVASHAILIVGYNDAQDCFIVKNSWGTGWGESGFFRIAYSQMENEVDFGPGGFAFGDAVIPRTLHAISLTGPNGGESWKKGSTQKIAWSYTGQMGSVVKIELYKGGTFQKTIAASAPAGEDGTGSFSWKVPTTLKTGSDYRIRISSNGDGSITDLSDSFFSITSESPSAALTLTTPNGGESVWMVNTYPTIIQWSYTGVPGPLVTVDLYKGGQFYQTLAAAVPLGSGGSGRFSWDLPDGFPVASDYRIRVTSLWDATIWDESDSNFSIAGAACRLVFTGPNGGESWQRGSSHFITWYTTCDWGDIGIGPTIKIDLYKGDSRYMSIASDAWMDYVFSWKIPACIPDGSDYKIRVTSVHWPQRYDTSDKPFEISGGIPLSALVLKAPNGGESWQMNTTRAITWYTLGVPVENVRIDVCDPSGLLSWTLAYSLPNRGYFIWGIVPSIWAAGDNLQMRISSVSDPSITYMSRGYFSIHETAPYTYLNVVSPVGGETWKAGSTQEIVWIHSGFPGKLVKVELFRGDNKVGDLVRSVKVGSDDRGSYSWNIPSSLKAGSNYKVRVSSLSDPYLYDFSDVPFAVTSPDPAPSITLTSPNGGEVWEKGALHYISWTYERDQGEDVRLELFKAGSKTLTIAASTSLGADGSGFQVWTPPASLQDGSDYTVRITSLLNQSVKDVSDKAFTIESFPVRYKFAGKWGSEGAGAGQFLSPSAVSVHPSGNIYVVDSDAHRIQKFDSKGEFLAKWGKRGTANGQFSYPTGLAIDAAGKIYVADAANRRIQKFDANGTFLAKWNRWGALDDEKFDLPTAVSIDPQGNIYVVDSGVFRILKFNSSFKLLSQWGSRGSGDGKFISPTGIAADAKSVYVSDAGNNRIQKFGPTGQFLMKWGVEGSAFGELNSPGRISLDAQGNLYVPDTGNHRVQKFNGTGKLITKWGVEGNKDGQFVSPRSVTVNSQGFVYVVDAGNHRIQKFAPPSPSGRIP